MGRTRPALLLVFLAVLTFLASAATASPVRAQSLPWHMASETYYHLDVAGAAVSVRVHVQVQSASSSSELKTVVLAAMPTAAHVVVKSGDTTLDPKVTPGSDSGSKPTTIQVNLPNPIRGAQKAELELTYDVPAYTGKLTRIQPGATETMFIGQGEGSFVFVDVPKSADNYFDPGCLVASDQPSDVKDAGYERWVCGDVTLIALNTDHPEVLARCAALDDKCRQRALPSLFSAFVQSITDPNLRGNLEADVQLQRGPTHLVLKYFKSDEAWAKREFAVAQAALPKLEAVFGFPYARDTILMRQSHHIEIAGAAGVAFPEQGEVLIAPDTGFDEEVTVHELAHQWAGSNLETGWLWEGLAEYGMRTIASSQGITPIDRRWDKLGYTDNLALWRDGSPVTNPDYWYGKAGAFWFAYRDAIGGAENMTRVLSQTALRPDADPFDGRWFMDRGEEISGANLDDLFLKWVFNPKTAPALLKDRRVAHDAVKALTARAATVGLSGTPTDIKANLDLWAFSGIDGQVAQANKLIDAYVSVLQLEKDAGLPASPGVAKSWGTDTLAHTQAVIENQRVAIQTIVGAAGQLAAEPEDSPARKQLADARDKYATGDFALAKSLASGSTETKFNQTAAGKLIELAKKEQAAFKPSFFGKIGMWMNDPDKDLADAQQALDSGDPKKALDLARSAYDGWHDADSRGLQRLAIFAGLMCALSAGIWYLLRRLDPPARNVGTHVQGHYIEPSSVRWRDWENSEQRSDQRPGTLKPPSS